MIVIWYSWYVPWIFTWMWKIFWRWLLSTAQYAKICGWCAVVGGLILLLPRTSMLQEGYAMHMVSNL